MNNTNIQLKIGAMALIAGLYSSAAVAAQVDGVATATLLEPITITNLGTMNFGTIAPGTNATTVSVDNAGAVTAPVAGGNAVVTVAGGSALTFDVTAESGLNYTLAIADGAMESAPASAVGPMTVTNFGNFVAAQSGTGAVQSFIVTADLQVGADQDAGFYSTANDTPISITADYD